MIVLPRQRFTALVGRPPLAYLTWWRMTAAARLLRETSEPLSAVARQCGYASEFAFAKAFKREFAIAPGAFRRAPDLLATDPPRNRTPRGTGPRGYVLRI